MCGKGGGGLCASIRNNKSTTDELQPVGSKGIATFPPCYSVVDTLARHTGLAALFEQLCQTPTLLVPSLGTV